MIVTFHIIAYIAFHVWDNFLAVLFENNDNASDNRPDEQPNRVDLQLLESNITTDLQGLDSNLPISPTSESKEIGLDTHRINSEDEIGMICSDDLPVCLKYNEHDEYGVKNTIFNIEPKFECLESEEKGLKFVPPVYTQRYMMVDSILKEPCWVDTVKKVVDFGCAEMTFESRYLKQLYGINEILAVDIDEDLLTHYFQKLNPSHTDFLIQRPTPLMIKIFCGSVGMTNDALIGCDAVIGIELIEHLFPPDIENLPFTVFGFIRPKIVIFTTPNSDFNVLFPNLTGFRHDDHKFEWTRQQFEDWANNLVVRYPDYTVTFQGIGCGPAGTEHLGCVSQMAVFVKMYESHMIDEHELYVQNGNYTLIKEYEYPYFEDKRSAEEKIRDSAIYFINRCISLSRHYDEDRQKEIPLQMVMERIQMFDRQKLKMILSENDWEVATNANGDEVIIFPDSDGEQSSYDEEEQSDIEHVENADIWTIPSEEDWGAKDESKGDFCNTISVTGRSSDINSSEDNWAEKQETNCVINKTHSNSIDYKPFEKNSILELGVVNSICDCGKDEQVINYSTHVTYDSFVDTRSVLEVEADPEVNVVNHSVPFSNNDITVQSASIDSSIYETPFTTSCKANEHSLFQNPVVTNPNGCCKALFFGSPKTYKEEVNIESTQPLVETKTESFYTSSSPSTLNTSIYATPCCSATSMFYKPNIPKCLSLQQINPHCDSSFLGAEQDNSLRQYELISENKNDKISKSMERFKSQESCDIHESCSNTSRVIDSGYPDSYSEHNMDLDLTLEQLDDIETESEGNDASSRSISPVIPQVQRVVDDVENGDVVNNNRDGEGNNMVADMEEDPLEFEARIEEANNEVLNLAANYQELDQLSNRSNSPEKCDQVEGLSFDVDKTLIDEKHTKNKIETTVKTDISKVLECRNVGKYKVEINSGSNEEKQTPNLEMPDSENLIYEKTLIEKLESNKIDLSLKNSQVDEGCMISSNILKEVKSTENDIDKKLSKPIEKQSFLEVNPVGNEIVTGTVDNNVTSKKSDMSVLTSCSWSHLSSSESLTYCQIQEGVNNYASISNPSKFKLKAQNSLSTVLDGCSKFSDCSIVKPNHREAVTDSTLRVDPLPLECSREHEREEELHEVSSRIFSQHDDVSLCSLYESAGSVVSDYSPFPNWLLAIELSDIEEDNLERVWEPDSYEVLPGLNQETLIPSQIDLKGGGDPYRNPWY